MEKIKGLIDAPFTPFHEDGSLNLAPIPEYAALLARNGLKGVFINGSSGEGYMLTEEERMQLAEAWMAAVPEDFKVIVHESMLRRLGHGALVPWPLLSQKSVASNNSVAIARRLLQPLPNFLSTIITSLPSTELSYLCMIS